MTTCRGRSLASLIHEQKSTANAVDAEVENLLAQAEAIKDNPDAFLPTETVNFAVA